MWDFRWVQEHSMGIWCDLGFNWGFLGLYRTNLIWYLAARNCGVCPPRNLLIHRMGKWVIIHWSQLEPPGPVWWYDQRKSSHQPIFWDQTTPPFLKVLEPHILSFLLAYFSWWSNYVEFTSVFVAMVNTSPFWWYQIHLPWPAAGAGTVEGGPRPAAGRNGWEETHSGLAGWNFFAYKIRWKKHGKLPSASLLDSIPRYEFDDPHCLMVK